MAAVLDKREAELVAELNRRRRELSQQIEALRQSAVATFDPREQMRQNPLGGVVTSLLTGFVLALAPLRLRAAPGDGRLGFAGAPLQAALGTVIAQLATTFLPALLEPLLGLLKGRSKDSDAPEK